MKRGHLFKAAALVAAFATLAVHSQEPEDYDQNGQLNTKAWAERAGKIGAASAAERFRSGMKDEDQAAKVQGGTSTAIGKIDSASGFSSRSKTDVDIPCQGQQTNRTKFGMTLKLSHCDGYYIVIDYCKTFRDSARLCKPNEYESTPLLRPGQSWTGPEISFVVNEVSSKEAKVTTYENIKKKFTHETMGEQGAAEASAQGSEGFYNRNRAFASGNVATGSGDTYSSINQRSGNFKNQNQRILTQWQATGDVRSDSRTCYQGECGKKHGTYAGNTLPGDCTTTCLQTETSTSTYNTSCTVLNNTGGRYCQQPIDQQTCFYTRQYTESSCRADNPNCPARNNSMCWRYRTETLTEPPPAAPGTTYTAEYYRCDTGDAPTRTCTKQYQPSQCTASPRLCGQNDSTARDDTEYGMGTCLQQSQQMSCPAGPLECEGNQQVRPDDPNCQTTSRQCRWDGQGQPYCPAVTSNADDNEPSGSGECNCEAIGQSCNFEGQESSCEEIQSDPRCQNTGYDAETDEDGRAVGTRFYYTCETSTTTCKESNTVCGEQAGTTPQSGGMEQAMAAAEMLKGVSEANASGIGIGSVKIFTGKAADCKRPIGDGVISKNCCNINLKKEEAGIVNECNAEDVEIASARRGKRSVDFGNYCSKKVNLGFTKFCVERTSTFCLFDSKLGRVVQEQGRRQLEAIVGASSGNQVQSADVEFDFYSTSETQGSWRNLTNLNGIPFVAWQWPRLCSNPRTSTGQNGSKCSFAQELYVATCEGNACPGLTSDPRLGPPKGSDWVFTGLERNEPLTMDLGKRSMSTGSCPEFVSDENGDVIRDANGNTTRNSTCRYKMSGYRSAAAQRALARAQVDWPVFSENGGQDTQGIPASGYVFRPYQISEEIQEEELPPRMVVDVTKVDSNGNPIGSGQISLNTKQPTMTPINVNGESWQYAGSCRKDIALCRYAFLIPKTVTVKPWCLNGNCRKQNLECSGFTQDQFAMLDMAQMDLAEVASDFEPQIPNEEAISVGGGVTGSAGPTNVTGSETEAVRLQPNNGDPPWTAKLQIAGSVAGPRGSDRVSIESWGVDWGDGSQTISGSGAATIAHLYPENYNGRDLRNATFQVVVNVRLSNNTGRTFRLKAYSWRNNKPAGLSQGENASGSTGTADPTSSPYGSSNDFPPPPPGN